MADQAFRDLVAMSVSEALQPDPDVLAAWEGGSAAFGAVDACSDIDLFFIVRDQASIDPLYAKVEEAIGRISPITTSHFVPPGRYYKLEDGGDFFFVDVCFVPARTSGQYLDTERHGRIVPIFDKGDWLRAPPLDADTLANNREHRQRELQAWFVVSQSFVRKAILRGYDAEAVAAYWAYTLRPLAELLRMRYCAVRWDFGWRYLERDLPPAEYTRLRELAFVADVKDLETKVDTATAWGRTLLQELAQVAAGEPPAAGGKAVKAAI